MSRFFMALTSSRLEDGECVIGLVEANARRRLMASDSNHDAGQAAIWNGVIGRGWVDTQDALDRLFEPFERLLVEETRRAGAGAVLDVGCGTGATTLAIARALGPSGGRAVGVDISEPMIARARERALAEKLPATFAVADAQAHAFDASGFDLIVSRFGVMFFDDPIAAFANLRRAARPGAALALIAWRSPADNPFMTAAERAAAPLLPSLPARRPDEPGQFGFANRSLVERILSAGGWSDIEIEPLDVDCAFRERDLLPYMTRLGLLARVLPTLGASDRERVIAAVRPAFDEWVHGGEVRFTAACWMIRARAA
jgi:SAM-dependent methyltransferase